MTIGILTEKASAAKNFAKALGGPSGTYNGEKYVIAAASGHLYEFVEPEEMVPPSYADKIGGYWDLAKLPWDETQFLWSREQKHGAANTIARIKKTLSSCTTIVIGSDIDPTGEGDLLAWEIIAELGLDTKKIQRMEFVDEAPASIQQAFINRRDVTSMHDEPNYLKAEFRSRFDLLSMQWTRGATKVLETTGRRAVLRNGRLKSAMVAIVGQGLDAYNDYKKIPFYQNRFIDDHGVSYVNPEEPRYKTCDEVPQLYKASAVECYEKSMKKTAPPRLLDLASLSALLSKEGFSAKNVLKTYQQMYETQVVSYPRTEDKTITPEQFKELAPLVDKIAGLVGVNPADLTHRQPRSTHVKPKGAHGANRPGLNVPTSIAAVKTTYGVLGQRIYEVLAKSYLTMLAEDYLYEHQKGRVVDYPAFLGTANVPKSLGWKGIFDVDAEADDDAAGSDAAQQGIGTRAEPEVFEGFPQRPPHPSMTWLMKQLDKHDVGTGATRTSTYAEVTAGKSALLKETRGKVTMTDAGQLNYLLLPGTHIGDLKLTERVYADMAAVAAGEKTAEQALEPVKQWVEEDIATMTRNAKNIPQELGKKLMTTTFTPSVKHSGTWNGEQVSFKKVYCGHEFSDAECEALLRGEELTITDAMIGGQITTVTGKLAHQSFNKDGKTIKFFGFKGQVDRIASADPAVYAVGVWKVEGEKIRFKRVWGGHKFTDKEIADLLEGREIAFDAMSKAKKPYTARGSLQRGEYNGNSFVGFQLAPRD